jgi:GDPmannose 4,6-dehydratase
MGAARMFRDDHGLFVASAILFNHESELRSSNFISKKLALAALRAKVDRSHSVSVGSLDAVADWGSARDYCQGMTAMLDAEQPDDFVLASGELRSVGDFAEECFNVVGLDWRNHVKSRGLPSFSRDWKLRGDASRLKCKSTWRPNHNFSDMVQDLVRRTEIEKKNGQRSSDFHSYL